ncbi:unnamed protein product [Prorocentrum cordatum]|uniref:Uncharacterized protein n=1 Tax=Prorocentrum cordatum TaxID=2364126 RepID=A0ABN9UDF1_9DINO|nr:unnamed protein product [Polarella glacialis]
MHCGESARESSAPPKASAPPSCGALSAGGPAATVPQASIALSSTTPRGNGAAASLLQWHALGEPWGLLHSAMLPVLKQCVTLGRCGIDRYGCHGRLARYGTSQCRLAGIWATSGNDRLGIIIVSVFFSHDYLMSCDPSLYGYPVAAGCEYTKAYVRCFPLLALLVAIMVSSRMFLQHRMYYRLLKHGVLLDIENFSPLSDPLFLCILFCVANAFMHYALLVWTSAGLSLFSNVSMGALTPDGLISGKADDASVFFIGPVVLYVVYLYGAYDTEASLLPLSKYFEEDPETARRSLAGMEMIQEPATAAAVRLDICPTGEALEAELPDDMEELLELLVKKAKARQRAAETDPEAVPPLSRWRLVSTMWPAELLLRGGLADDESHKFRQSWYCFCALALAVMIGILYSNVESLIDKIADVLNGQANTDTVGAIVIALHIALNLYLIRVVLINVTYPCRA